jgi:hypothetical protein
MRQRVVHPVVYLSRHITTLHMFNTIRDLGGGKIATITSSSDHILSLEIAGLALNLRARIQDLDEAISKLLQRLKTDLMKPPGALQRSRTNGF